MFIHYRANQKDPWRDLWRCIRIYGGARPLDIALSPSRNSRREWSTLSYFIKRCHVYRSKTIDQCVSYHFDSRTRYPCMSLRTRHSLRKTMENSANILWEQSFFSVPRTTGYSTFLDSGVIEVTCFQPRHVAECPLSLNFGQTKIYSGAGGRWKVTRSLQKSNRNGRGIPTERFDWRGSYKTAKDYDVKNVLIDKLSLDLPIAPQVIALVARSVNPRFMNKRASPSSITFVPNESDNPHLQHPTSPRRILSPSSPVRTTYMHARKIRACIQIKYSYQQSFFEYLFT